MADEPKILALVLHSEAEPWKTIGETQLKTWMSRMPDGCSALHYVGNATHTHLDGGMLRVAVPETGLWRLGPKTLEAFRWALENREFDYIFRTNTSSYVNMEMLQAFMRDKPRERYYGGNINRRHGGFASGCGYALSRDMVEALAYSGLLLDHCADDVAVFEAMRDLGVDPINHPRTDLETGAQLAKWRASGRQQAFHYRCKGQRGTRPRWDISVMEEIHATKA